MNTLKFLVAYVLIALFISGTSAHAGLLDDIKKITDQGDKIIDTAEDIIKHGTAPEQNEPLAQGKKPTANQPINANDLTLAFEQTIKGFYQFKPISNVSYPYFKTEEGKQFSSRCMKAKKGRLSLSQNSGLTAPIYLPKRFEMVQVKGLKYDGKSCTFDNIARIKGEISPEGQRVTAALNAQNKAKPPSPAPSTNNAQPKSSPASYKPYQGAVLSEKQKKDHDNNYRKCMSGNNGVGYQDNAEFCQCYADTIIERKLQNPSFDAFFAAPICDRKLYPEKFQYKK